MPRTMLSLHKEMFQTKKYSAVKAQFQIFQPKILPLVENNDNLTLPEWLKLGLSREHLVISSPFQ